MSNYTSVETAFMWVDNLLINLHEVESFREELHSDEGVKYPVVVISYKSGRHIEIRRTLSSIRQILETRL